MSVQKFSQTLAASEIWRLQVGGDYFRLGVTAYPVTLRFLLAGAVESEMLMIDGGTWARVDGGFDGIEIINSASGAQTLDIFIGRGEIGIDRILGEVSVINGELSRVKSGSCFLVVAGLTAGAGQYPQLQIFNPAGSGKNVIINSVVAGCTSAGLIYGNYGIVQLANLVGPAKNKRLGGAVSASELRYEANAVLVASTAISFVNAAANDSREMKFSEPLLLPPGYGFGMYSNNLAVNLTVSIQFIEEAS